jgi:schlafen family protein
LKKAFNFRKESKISVPTLQNYRQQIREFESAQEEKMIEEIIKKGESEMLEFKSSMIWDYKLNKPNKAVLWQPILKNIVAFMNSEGGTLVVGITDDGEIMGLERDFESLAKKKSWDEWMRHFVNIFNEYVGKEYMTFVKVKHVNCSGKPIAIIEVSKNNLSPVYLDPNGKADFYIRSGTTAQQLNPKQMFSYIKQWHILYRIMLYNIIKSFVRCSSDEPSDRPHLELEWKWTYIVGAIIVFHR